MVKTSLIQRDQTNAPLNQLDCRYQSVPEQRVSRLRCIVLRLRADLYFFISVSAFIGKCGKSVGKRIVHATDIRPGSYIQFIIHRVSFISGFVHLGRCWFISGTFFLLCIEKMKKKAIIDLWQRRRKDINLQKNKRKN